MLFFFFNDTATTEIYTLSLHDALPILIAGQSGLELRHHFLGDVIPLLDFHPVGCEARRKLARRSEKRQRQNQDSRHHQDVSAAMKRYMIAETGIFPRGDPP